MVHAAAGRSARAQVFLPLLYEAKTLLMQRLQDAVARGYTQWVMGRTKVDKVPALARKFRDLYGVHLSRMARTRRKAVGLGNATLYLLLDGEVVLWFLLVSPGDHPARQLEKLHDAATDAGRIQLDSYELVRLEPTLKKPEPPAKLPPSPTEKQKTEHRAALKVYERRLKSFKSGGRATNWTWRYTRPAYDGWRDRIRREVRDPAAAALLAQSIQTLYRTPGFRGAREQVKNLAALLRAEWKRAGRARETMPAIPKTIGYVRRLQDSGRRVGDIIKAQQGDGQREG